MTYNFIHVPKTAGNSLREILEPSKIIYHGHVRASDVRYSNMFSFIRNPYDRVVSTYFYLKSGGIGNSLDTEFCKIISKYSNFENFVKYINEHQLISKILHLKPMHYWVCDDQGNILSTCYKIEHVEEIDAFLHSLGLRGIRYVKSNTSKHLDYTKYMTDEVKEILYKLYETDFKLFNYNK